MNWTSIIVMALAGALGAILVNRGIAVYHDALRALVPELIEGRMARRDLAGTAFGFSFGLLIGFGLPVSLAATVLMAHALWLGTDAIGAWFPGSFAPNWRSDRTSLWGLVGAGVAGALYGILLIVGFQAALAGLDRLPVNILQPMGQIRDAVVVTFAAFPTVTVAYQAGARHGIATFLVALVGRQLAVALGLPTPDAWALAIGLAALLFHALCEPRDPDGDQWLLALATERIGRLKAHLPAIALLGAIYGLACNLALLMEGPQSAMALGQGDRAAVIPVLLARSLSLIPLRVMSVLTTGVFCMDGFGLVPAAALAAPNAVIAVVAGALVMGLEALSVIAVTRLLGRYPGLLRAADNMRTGMTKVLEVATLVGAMMAAQAMAPGLGLFAVAGLYLLNETAGTPVVRAAVGPAAAIAVGLLVNVLAVLQLYPLPT